MPISAQRARAPRFRRPAIRYAGASDSPPLRLLFLHRDATTVERCLQELKSVQVEAVGEVARTPEQFSERLSSGSYDLILAEYPNSTWAGAQPLQRLHRIQRQKQIPLIFLAEQLRRETAAELLSNGAADCVDAEHLSHLPVAIRRALDGRSLRTERDRAEHQLRHSEAHHRELVGNLTYGLCCCDLSGRFLDADQALVAMLGYGSKEELLEANRAGHISCDPPTRERLRGHVAGEHADSVETEWKRKDGTLLKIRLTGRNVTWTEGPTPAYELIAENITKQRALEDHQREAAARDPLTGLANYRELAHVLDCEIKRSSRTGREFAVLVFDVDRLKRINDEHGHEIGSQALCRVADLLCTFSRQIDTAARLGGDEFALVLPETGHAPAQVVANRILDQLARDRHEPRISVSVGLAVYPQDGGRIDALLSVADDAMAAMKGRHHDLPRPAVGR